MIKSIDGKKLKEMIDNESDQLEIIDVREKDEYNEIRIKDSKLIPMNEIEERVDEIDWNKNVVFVCRSGARSGYVAEMLSKTGKDVINLSGGVYELNIDQCDCLERS